MSKKIAIDHAKAIIILNLNRLENVFTLTVRQPMP